jgi:hypothetical protein
MGRYKLWFNLTQNPGEDLFLKIPHYLDYGRVIDRAFPHLRHIPWKASTKETGFTYFKDLSTWARPMLEAFLHLLEGILLLTRTDHLAAHFANELTEAYALDFNFQQGVDPLTYTVAGQLEHNAKENRDPHAIAELSRMLAETIQNHPTLSRANVIAAVPPRPSKDFHLPTELVNAIGTHLNRPVGLQLAKAEVPKLRDLTLEQKIATLEGAFTLGEPIVGKTILLVDDLYQSGVTLWMLARFLKSQGAREVYGLACVKSWRDTDNVA